MPVMDGLSATREIRNREIKSGGKPILIVGLSGNAREEQVDEAMAAGMNRYLTKPIKTQELADILYTLTSRNK